MGQRGLLDRLFVAHMSSVTTLDWCNRLFTNANPSTSISGLPADGTGNGIGWLVSGGLDRCIKVWDLTAPAVNARMPNKPTYNIHPSFPVRRVVWRPSYECELAIVSNAEFPNPDLAQNGVVGAGPGGDGDGSTETPSLPCFLSAGIPWNYGMLGGVGFRSGVLLDLQGKVVLLVSHFYSLLLHEPYSSSLRYRLR